MVWKQGASSASATTIFGALNEGRPARRPKENPATAWELVAGLPAPLLTGEANTGPPRQRFRRSRVPAAGPQLGRPLDRLTAGRCDYPILRIV
jgi:hypothetical protein